MPAVFVKILTTDKRYFPVHGVHIYITKGIVGRACAYAYMYTVQVKCMLGSEVDAIMGVGKCKRVVVYGRYCGCTSSRTWNVVEHGRKKSSKKYVHAKGLIDAWIW